MPSHKITYIILGNFADGVTKFTFASKRIRDEYLRTLGTEMSKDLYKGQMRNNTIQLEECCPGSCNEHCIARIISEKGISKAMYVNVK
ncbi:MAG: hypothetical protein PHG66_01680 [Candidatus Colwellbacteria bacterium]|nr:hypothetical protein [Candidatus Colwellbacteria bacterium]